VVAEAPYPQLLVARPGAAAGELRELSEVSRYHLVAAGKHGAAEAVAGLAGRRVRLAGSLIYRDDQVMVEIVPGSVELLGTGTPPAVGEELGQVTLVGEIVDSKCFLGVMKPGRGKPHRACASLCIRGGIPPLLRVETAAGEHADYLLVNADGGAVNHQILDWVAEPVEITGHLRRLGDLLVLAADPATYRRPIHHDREET
jgi:hypothetical protein